MGNCHVEEGKCGRMSRKGTKNKNKSGKRISWLIISIIKMAFEIFFGAGSRGGWERLCLEGTRKRGGQDQI